MSGHSKWSTIKRKKGKADAERGKLFTKLIREITIAAKDGGSDTEANPRLRTALVAARAGNMPAANIERAIKKGTGELPGVTYEEIAYEGYGPNGVAFLIETLTDNRNRTTADIRHLLTKHGGSMGEVGSVAWLFEKKGMILLDKSAGEEDDVLMVALEAGAEDVSDDDEFWAITTPDTMLHEVAGRLTEAGMNPERVELVRIPTTTIELDRSNAAKVLKLADLLEDNDDVQTVSANFDIPDELMAELTE